MKEAISVLGSTGSIGTQTLDVLKQHSDLLCPLGFSAGSNIELFIQQIKTFSPEIICVKEEKNAEMLRKFFPDLDVIFGDEGNIKIARHPLVDRVVVATPGLPGIKPTLEAIKVGKTIALATKEVLVAAGSIVIDEVDKNGVQILPIDSEHSAIFQCLRGHSIDEVNKIYLTCSGGPFRRFSADQLKKVTVEQTLNHPNWKMGRKITVDSATLMNKGFEAIEAHFLFGIPMERIEIIIHPQSIIHSAIEFVDGSIIAQMGPADMRLPIQYALFYPKERRENNFRRFSFSDYPTLSFEKPDLETFRCLRLAFEAMQNGGTYPAVLNAANDIAVEAFLNGSLSFHKIPEVIEKALEKHTPKYKPTLDDIFEDDSWAREIGLDFIRSQ